MAFEERSERDLDLERLIPHVEELATKFDTVQVFVTRHDITRGETAGLTSGFGNWHARRGQVHEWLVQQDELSRASVRDDFEDEE